MLHFSQKNPGPSAAERENTTPKLSLQALLPRDEFVCSLMVKQILFSGCFLLFFFLFFSFSPLCSIFSAGRMVPKSLCCRSGFVVWAAPEAGQETPGGYRGLGAEVGLQWGALLGAAQARGGNTTILCIIAMQFVQENVGCFEQHTGELGA